MKKLTLGVLATLCSILVNAANIYVDHTVTTTIINPGQTWGNAYSRLEDALTVANSGDIIRIAKGTYTASSGRYILKDGVIIYGGHPAALPGISIPDYIRNLQRNPANHPVILKGTYRSAITANTIISSSTVINGVTFGGFRDGLEISNNTYVFEAQFSNCRFEGGQYGIHIHDSENDFIPTFTNCVFTSNTGGVYLQSSTYDNIGVLVSPTFIKCKFYELDHGVALKANVGIFTPHFEKCDFHEIYGYAFTNLGFEDGYGIGAGYINSSCPSISDFKYNPTIENSIFYNTRGILDALVSFNCPSNEVKTKFTNCTFFDNKGAQRPTFSLHNFHNGSSNTQSVVGLELENCISYDNVNVAGRLMQLGRSMAVQVRNSMIEAQSTNSNGTISDPIFQLIFPHSTIHQVIDLGGNVYNQDPKFKNATLTVPDLDLLGSSPARNTGYLALSPFPGPIAPVETDYKGRIRVNESNIDMGAYEYCSTTHGCYPLAVSDRDRLVPEVIGSGLQPGITVYPNPFKNILNITKKSGTNAHITIYSITGELVFEDSFDAPNNTVDLSEYPNGVYTVTVRDAVSSSTQKVIKK